MGIIASQAARELGISARTLATWSDKGRIKSTRSAGGWRLYDEKDVQRLKKELLKRQAGAIFSANEKGPTPANQKGPTHARLRAQTRALRAARRCALLIASSLPSAVISCYFRARGGGSLFISILGSILVSAKGDPSSGRTWPLKCGMRRPILPITRRWRRIWLRVGMATWKSLTAQQ